MANNSLSSFVSSCHRSLMESNSDEINVPRNYLSQRNVSKKSMSVHRIGYCFEEEYIPDEIKFYGRDKDSIYPNDNGYSYCINGHIIVPIYSEFGDTVGIATRKPSSVKGETWWNSPSPFKKGNHIFLLDKTRKNIFENNKIYLVEGYMDAIILYQEGISSVGCLMGTHLTPRKIGLIARYCKNICLCLDVDENKAGQKALEKAIYVIKSLGFFESLSVIDQLPVGEDPDVYIIKNGLQKFLSLERRLSNSEIKNICRNFVIRNKRK